MKWRKKRMCRLKRKRRKMRQRSKYTDTPMGVTEAETGRSEARDTEAETREASARGAGSNCGMHATI